MEKDTIILDLNEESKRLSERTGLSYEIAYAYVLAEDKYYDKIGLNCYDKEDYVKESNIVLEVSDMNNYISKKPGIPMDTCDLLAEAEEKYFCEIGLIDSSDLE